MASEVKKRNKTIAVVTYPGVALLDLVATKTVLDELAMATRYRSVSVGERTEAIASNTPMRIIPEKRFEEVPAPFALIIPGGGMASLEAMGNERLINYLRYAELLKRLGVDYVEGYSVEDGKFLTMAGVSGGIDTTLELVAKLRSEGAAKLIQTDIEYDPQPPFGGLDWGEADGDELVQTLEEDRMDLEQALAGRPDLYQKLFG